MGWFGSKKKKKDSKVISSKKTKGAQASPFVNTKAGGYIKPARKKYEKMLEEAGKI